MATAVQHKKKPDLSGKTVYLSTGQFNGKAIWHYILVDKIKLPILLKDAELHKQVDVTRYGNILFSGFGEKPPEEVKICIQKKYGAH